MKNIFLVTVLLAFAPFAFTFGLILILFSYNQNLNTKKSQTISYVPIQNTQNVLAAASYADDGGSEKVEKIRVFLARYNSPLEPYAQDIVNAAEQYGLDYRLIPAIAMQESGLCKTIPNNSYNCWGFGIYSGKVTRFSDYKEAIYTVTQALANRYKNQGLVTPEQIMTMYTPNSNGSWATGVNHFMEQLQ